MAESTGIRRKTAYHHGDLRAQLVEATRALVEEKGADHFSVSEACRKAGVSTAAPYRHFRDREEMLDAVCMDGMARHFSRMQAAVAELPAGDLQRIHALGRVYVRFAQAEPGVFRLVFGAKHDPDVVRAVEEAGILPFELLQAEVAGVLGRATVDADVERRAFLLWMSVHGLSFLLIDGAAASKGLDVNLDSLLDDVARRVLPEAADR